MYQLLQSGIVRKAQDLVASGGISPSVSRRRRDPPEIWTKKLEFFLEPLEVFVIE